MREIKFRVWDGLLKYMLPDYDNWIDCRGRYWTSPSKCYDTPYQEIIRPRKNQSQVIMQYTGLKDRNGKEIYEGDVLEVGEQGIRYKVCWLNVDEAGEFIASFGLENLKTGEFFVIDHYAVKFGVVIGNIYENPELIKTP